MKKTEFTETQIVAILKEGAGRTSYCEAGQSSTSRFSRDLKRLCLPVIVFLYLRGPNTVSKEHFLHTLYER